MAKSIKTLELSDKELVSRILSGEKSLYEVIVRRYNGYLYKVGRTYGYTHSDTEDLMQETYVNAYVHLKDFENRSSFKTWIVKIMLHQCFHKRQKFSYKNEEAVSAEIGDNDKPAFGNGIDDGEKTVQTMELKEIIEDAVLKIPEAYRMVFTLREINGLTTFDTASLLDITESNVKVRLNRAKKMLQTQLEKTYSADDLFEFNLIHCDGIVNRVFDQIKDVHHGA